MKQKIKNYLIKNLFNMFPDDPMESLDDFLILKEISLK